MKMYRKLFWTLIHGFVMLPTIAVRENEVDITALGLIDDEQVKVLIPTIGPQAKFKKALADWKAALQKKEGDDHIKEHHHDEIDKIIEEYGKDIGGLTPSRSSPIISPAVTPTSRKSSLCSPDLSSRINLNPIQDLTELLQTTQEGRHLLKRRDGPLGDALRKILVKEIAVEILKYDPEAPVRNVIYLHWIQQIGQVFPAENCSIYYTKASDGPGRAHGRLYDAVTNLKAKFRRNKVYQPKARRSLLDKTLTPEPPKEYANKRITSLLEEDSASTSDEDLDSAEVIEECLEWLHCSADNLALCTEKWAKTRKLRLQRVLSEETHTYLLEFPCLQRSWGHSLLVADFNQWYPGNENSFENNFPLVKKKLIALFRNVSNKSPFVKELKDLVNNSHVVNRKLVDVPQFERPIGNHTFHIGKEALLGCSVINLGKHKVGWLRAEDQTVLSLNDRVVLSPRYSVNLDTPSTWQLRIRPLRAEDRGCYMCQINTQPSMKWQIGCIDVYVPPDIINEETSADVSAQELDNVTLICRASGHPPPKITWRREDHEPMLLKKVGSRDFYKVESYTGSSLPLWRVDRRQMGAFLCIAANDVPPGVSKRIILNVNFSPTVIVPNQLLGAPLGTDVVLECTVEAYPNTINYWLKNRGEMLLDGPKYVISEERSSYRVMMKLTIKYFSRSDIGTYNCVSTNSLGKSEGTLRLYEIKLYPSSQSAAEVNIGGLTEGAVKQKTSFNNSTTMLPKTLNIIMLLILLLYC